MPDPATATPARPVDLDHASDYARHRDHSAAQCENGDRLILRLAAELRAARKSIDPVPEAGGHPARLVTAAAEYVRAADHATLHGRPGPGLLDGAGVDDAAGALYLLCSRLPQLCRQLAEILTAAAGQDTLAGPQGAPELAAAELRQAAEILTAAYARLDAAWQPLSPVGGWLSADADALAGEEED